jgi:hypothetical protein
MPTHVIHLAQQMIAGQWMLNGEPLIFDYDGNVIDGQHRLAAVAFSGVACDMLFVEGVDPNAFMTIDGGRVRTNGNIMKIHGVSNYNLIAGITASVINYRRALSANDGEGGSINSHIRASKSDLLKEYDKHQDEYQHAAHLAMKCRRICHPSPLGSVAAIAILEGNQEKDVINMFFESIASGANIDVNSPIHKLRDRLIRNMGSMSKLSKNQLILLIAKAWNYYAKEKPCGVLRLDSENVFPIL